MASTNGIRPIRGVNEVEAITKAPRAKRRFPLLRIEQESPEEKLEKRITHGHAGTLPERLVIQWCIDMELSFAVQWRIFVSRTMWRSARIDIVVFDYRGIVEPLAIRVQGDYWHQSPGKKYSDDVQAQDLTLAGYLVVDCWESDILTAAENNRMHPYMEDQIYSARRR